MPLLLATRGSAQPLRLLPWTPQHLVYIPQHLVYISQYLVYIPQHLVSTCLNTCVVWVDWMSCKTWHCVVWVDWVRC